MCAPWTRVPTECAGSKRSTRGRCWKRQWAAAIMTDWNSIIGFRAMSKDLDKYTVAWREQKSQQIYATLYANERNSKLWSTQFLDNLRKGNETPPTRPHPSFAQITTTTTSWGSFEMYANEQRAIWSNCGEADFALLLFTLQQSTGVDLVFLSFLPFHQIWVKVNDVRLTSFVLGFIPNMTSVCRSYENIRSEKSSSFCRKTGDLLLLLLLRWIKFIPQRNEATGVGFGGNTEEQNTINENVFGP